jgi:hypothetical protein
MAPRLAELYEEDFYAWTQEQARTLREQFRGDNRLDIEHLAEEIEDLGSSELQAVESFVEQILAHLLKLDYSAQTSPRTHWRAEILNFRMSATRKMSPTIRRKMEADIAGSYARARQIAAVGAMVHEPDMIRRLPRVCPYDWQAVWQRDVLAEAGIDLSEGEDAPKKRRKRKA